MNKPTMILLVGPTGCGKSTFRKKYLSHIPCISPDDFIVGRWSPHKTLMAWTYAAKVADTFLHENNSFLVDAQFVNPDIRNEWVKKARAHKFQVYAVCFKTPWAQIVKNHEKRGDRGGYGTIPADVVRSMFDKFERSTSGPSNWFLFDKVMTVKWGSRKDRAWVLQSLT